MGPVMADDACDARALVRAVVQLTQTMAPDLAGGTLVATWVAGAHDGEQLFAQDGWYLLEPMGYMTLVDNGDNGGTTATVTAMAVAVARMVETQQASYSSGTRDSTLRY